VLDDGQQRERANFDVGQATLQMMVAAADLGIGSGHSAVGDQARARELLGFPQGRYATIMVDLGYPAGRPLAPIRRPDRRAFDEVVHRERW
jgi:nitroreductase